MEILNLIQNLPSPVVASFSVYIPAIKMTIHNLKLVRKKTGGIFLSFPSYLKEENGEKKWGPCIEFSTDKKEEFKEKIFDLLKFHHGIE